MTTHILLVIDGFGFNPLSEYNAIALANTPHYSKLLASAPHSLLEASGLAVGLPEGQMGNSEVGHMTLGSGRVIFQSLPKISHAIKTKDMEHNIALNHLSKTLINNHGTCHIIGLISDGGVHSHIEHIISFAQILLNRGIKVLIHAITDGRDTPPQSAQHYLNQLVSAGIEVASVSGRFYAMDRDNRWERTECAYNAIAHGDAPKFHSPIELLEENYSHQIFDEFIPPHISNNYEGIKENDAIFIANFRADRIRQILSAFLEPTLDTFPLRKKVDFTMAIGVTPYSPQLDEQMHICFPVEEIKNTLGEVIANAGLAQLRLAETEKYAHVTFFFNGGSEASFLREDRILIDSPKVRTYDLIPQMSIDKVTDSLINAIKSRKYDFICVNFANADMVGHTGNMEATIAAIEAIDHSLGKIISVVAAEGSELLITADHGNAELMRDPLTLAPLTSHTMSKVPLVYLGTKNIRLKDGTLSNVAPTLLELMSLKKPPEMTANSLIY